jgi:hypothetical protein
MTPDARPGRLLSPPKEGLKKPQGQPRLQPTEPVLRPKPELLMPGALQNKLQPWPPSKLLRPGPLQKLPPEPLWK